MTRGVIGPSTVSGRNPRPLGAKKPRREGFVCYRAAERSISSRMRIPTVLTSSPPLRTGIPTAFFKIFILKNHFGGFLLHRRCMLYPCELGMANVSSVRRITVPT